MHSIKGKPLRFFFLTQLNLFIIVGLMQKETVIISKLKELRDFEILVGNPEQKLGRKEKLILGKILTF